MGEFQPLHWLVVIGAVLILFGPKRLPEIGKSLGESIGAFKKAMREGLSSDSANEKTSDSSKTA